MTLAVKVPTLRRWGKKLAVVVDSSFFNAIGGMTDNFSHDLRSGDIIWLILEISENYELEPLHWEVLELEKSSEKLLAAKTVDYEEFEETLKKKLKHLKMEKFDEQ